MCLKSVGLVFILSATSFAGTAFGDNTEESPLIERGRYLVKVSGCNDCHTPGYLKSDGKVPESEWLKGDTFGWRGAWGTTYASNLRLYMQKLDEKAWIQDAKTMKRRPPMPWFNLNDMKEEDLKAIYHFVRSLGEPGVPAPAYVPPGEEPSQPYALFPIPPNS